MHNLPFLTITKGANRANKSRILFIWRTIQGWNNFQNVKVENQHFFFFFFYKLVFFHKFFFSELRKFSGFLLRQSRQSALHFARWRWLTEQKRESRVKKHGIVTHTRLNSLRSTLLLTSHQIKSYEGSTETHQTTVVQPSIPGSQEEMRLISQTRCQLARLWRTLTTTALEMLPA